MKDHRKKIIELSRQHGGYHYGSSFSCVEILQAIYSVKAPDDQFILSKGHACWAWYPILRELGYNPVIQGHPSRDPANGIIATTGSLGHGLPLAIGLAMADKGHHVYVLMGDGELQEGTTWESMAIAAHYDVGNLTVIVDENGIQGSGFTGGVLPLRAMETFILHGWAAYHLEDGHDIEALTERFSKKGGSRPKIVFARTVKGKGVSFMENNPAWHAKWLGGEELERALEELK